MKRGNALRQNILSTDVRQGDAAFWWLGQMGFIVRTQRFTLAIDPFLTPSDDRIYEPLLAPQELDFADLILGTHDHGDHIDREAWPMIAATSPQTRFVVPKTLLSQLSQELSIPSERFIGVDMDCAWEENGLTIRGIPSAHELLDRRPDGYPYMGYVVEADGVRLYHSGDSCCYDGMESAIRRIGALDMVFLPINGRDGLRLRRGCIGNMTWQEAVDLAGALAPALFVPAHYEMFDTNRGDIAACAEYLEMKYPAQRFWIGAHGERQILSSLTDGTSNEPLGYTVSRNGG